MSYSLVDWQNDVPLDDWCKEIREKKTISSIDDVVCCRRRAQCVDSGCQIFANDWREQSLANIMNSRGHRWLGCVSHTENEFTHFYCSHNWQTASLTRIFRCAFEGIHFSKFSVFADDFRVQVFISFGVCVRVQSTPSVLKIKTTFTNCRHIFYGVLMRRACAIQCVQLTTITPVWHLKHELDQRDEDKCTAIRYV